jgi:hypothetical protein
LSPFLGGDEGKRRAKKETLESNGDNRSNLLC